MMLEGRVVFRILVLILVSLLFPGSTAQNERYVPRSPFARDAQNRRPGTRGAEPSGPATAQSYPRHPDNDVMLVKSPFTPPPFVSSASPRDNSRGMIFPVRPEAETIVQQPREVKRVNEITDFDGSDKMRNDANLDSNKTNDVRYTEPPSWPVESPFSPPAETKWQENQKFRTPSTWTEEADKTPSLPSNRGASDLIGPQRKVRGEGLPQVSVYQEGDNSERDMHIEAPGVTPWTRYTPRPRVRVQEVSPDTRASARARCGRQGYFPRQQICCQGQVRRRQGMKPSCCGRQPFDAVFSKCCDGVVSLRTVQDPDCRQSAPEV